MSNSATSALKSLPLASPKSLPLKILYWAELKSLQLDFGRLQKASGEQPDLWWVAVGKKLEGPIAFEQALERVLGAVSPVRVVHDSLARQIPVPWQSISHRAWWSNPQTSVVWTVGFWAIVALLGWLAVGSLAPTALKTEVDLAYWGLVGGFIALRTFSDDKRNPFRRFTRRLFKGNLAAD